MQNLLSLKPITKSAFSALVENERDIDELYICYYFLCKYKEEWHLGSNRLNFIRKKKKSNDIALFLYDNAMLPYLYKNKFSIEESGVDFYFSERNFPKEVLMFPFLNLGKFGISDFQKNNFRIVDKKKKLENQRLIKKYDKFFSEKAQQIVQKIKVEQGESLQEIIKRKFKEMNPSFKPCEDFDYHFSIKTIVEQVKSSLILLSETIFSMLNKSFINKEDYEKLTQQIIDAIANNCFDSETCAVNTILGIMKALEQDWILNAKANGKIAKFNRFVEYFSKIDESMFYSLFNSEGYPYFAYEIYTLNKNENATFDIDLFKKTMDYLLQEDEFADIAPHIRVKEKRNWSENNTLLITLDLSDEETHFAKDGVGRLFSNQALNFDMCEKILNEKIEVIIAKVKQMETLLIAKWVKDKVEQNLNVKLPNNLYCLEKTSQAFIKKMN